MSRESIISELVSHIKSSYSVLDRKRYSQEHAYVNALLGRLVGKIEDEDSDGFLELKTTIINDKGPGAAEKQYGADFAIILETYNTDSDIRKAILGQAKTKSIEDLSKTEKKKLSEQCAKMRKYTEDFIVLEAPIGNESPSIIQSNTGSNYIGNNRVPLEEYLIDSFIECIHGDTRDSFVESVLHSDLHKLIVEINTLNMDLSPRESSGPRPGL